MTLVILMMRSIQLWPQPELDPDDSLRSYQDEMALVMLMMRSVRQHPAGEF